MLRIKQDELPFRGSSHHFVGADQGGVNISVFLFNGEPGSGPGPHRHPYDEVQFIRAGRGLWNVDGVEFEAGAASRSMCISAQSSFRRTSAEVLDGRYRTSRSVSCFNKYAYFAAHIFACCSGVTPLPCPPSVFSK